MADNRITLVLKVNLDPVPGAFHTEMSAIAAIAGILNDRISHYEPQVMSLEAANMKYTDSAIRITDEMLQRDGRFFLISEAYYGWYCVKSTDPEKRGLYLPPHIFNKCFKWVDNHPRDPNEFSPIVER